jgi:hypothetical protein
VVFAGDYTIVYQSFELGETSQADVAMKKFDPMWNKLESIWVSNATAFEGSNSLIFLNGVTIMLRIAYVAS